MKQALAIIALGGVLATPAFADKPGRDWMSLDQVAAKLTAAGYGRISKIEADDGEWKAVADKDGQTYKLKLDPKSGAVVKSEPDKDDD